MSLSLSPAPVRSARVRVLVLAEYYPRAADPVLGIWAHRQALAARDAGADVRVLVLHRPIPPLSALRSGDLDRALRTVRQPAHAELDHLNVRYVRYLSPPRGLSYASWGAWAAPPVMWHAGPTPARRWSYPSTATSRWEAAVRTGGARSATRGW
jgi:hypothetical protein